MYVILILCRNAPSAWNGRSSRRSSNKKERKTVQTRILQENNDTEQNHKLWCMYCPFKAAKLVSSFTFWRKLVPQWSGLKFKRILIKVSTGPPQVVLFWPRVLAYCSSLFSINLVRRYLGAVYICTYGQVIAGRPHVVVTVPSSVTYTCHCFTGCVYRRGSDNLHPIILCLFHFLSEDRSARVPQHTAVV